MKSFISPVMILIVLFSTTPGFCSEGKLWAIAAKDSSGPTTLRHLLDSPQSLQSLGQDYQQGWGIGYYLKEGVGASRSSASVVVDKSFRVVIEEVAPYSPGIVIANLAKTRAACLLDNPNPQPFKRVRNGKTWLFAHDGEIPVQVLRPLVGDEALKTSPPQACFETGPEGWQDSELYFLFLLKKIEEKDGRVEEAVREALKEIENNLGEQASRGSNFFLSDGKRLWAYRGGSPLYLSVQANPRTFMVASTPTGEPEAWKEIPDDVIVILDKEAEPRVVALSENTELTPHDKDQQ